MDNSQGSRLSGEIGQVSVPVRNIEKSISFYRDTLGLPFLFSAPPGLGFFNCNGVRLMLDAPAVAHAGKSSVIYFRTINIFETFQMLKAKGVLFESEPHLIAKMPDHELWMSFFYDPDENILALMAEITR